MRSFTLFLLSNILIFLMAVLHLIGYFLGKPAAETGMEKQIYDMLHNYELNMMGIYRTYNDLISGYSLIFATTTLFFGFFNMSLLTYLKKHLPIYRKILLLNILLWGIELVIFITFMVLPQIVLTGMILITFLISYFLIDSRISA